ncbi:aspartate kinase [Brevundimonas sp.]|uniref:aspartate kinase n=1 Tax=Brevundimonas sp. TaxID=1871086 RepID=UPI002D637D7A|nr:aspartate kinase [Brevundimonas sp.]HYD26148.1 aspartate kinase [Brevundimonas sp.]
MALIVQKYGGTSVANPERIRNVARRVARFRALGHQVVVVVSAMSGETNKLIALAKEIMPDPDPRELDVLVSTGEQVTIALLSLALMDLGVKAKSYTGAQVRILTDGAHTKARILQIDEDNIRRDLNAGHVVVVAGFQGVDEAGDITTLGRGGSDTTGVALAAALKADECQIYTDVDGVYTTDPRIESRARRLEKVSYEEMLEMASLGAKVLQTRSVELAMAKQVPVRVLSSFIEPDENGVLPAKSGTLICDEEEIVEKRIVSGVTMSRDEARITLLGLSDRVEAPADVFTRLAEANVNVDMIVQSQARTEGAVNLTFTTGRRDAPRAAELMRAAQAEIGFEEIRVDEDVAKVSVVGVGMRSHAGVAQTMFRALADKGVKFQAISTSEIKISVLIDAAYAELAVRALHSAYGLEAV